MENVIDTLGGTTTVARLLGVSAPSVHLWRTRGVPIERCVPLERLNGKGVKRWHLRPADWHQIWPELIGAEGAPNIEEARHAA